MKTWFHGTCDIWLPSIEKVGLKPMHENAWRVTFDGVFYDPYRDDDNGFVFLSSERFIARNYAKAKAHYLATKPGEDFALFPFAFSQTGVKDEGSPVIKAKPILLVILLPEDAELTSDPHSANAMRFHGTIQPSAIQRVIHVH